MEGKNNEFVEMEDREILQFIRLLVSSSRVFSKQLMSHNIYWSKWLEQLEKLVDMRDDAGYLFVNTNFDKHSPMMNVTMRKFIDFVKTDKLNKMSEFVNKMEDDMEDEDDDKDEVEDTDEDDEDNIFLVQLEFTL